MAIEAKFAAPKTPATPTNPTNSGRKLAPEELAELIDSHEYDEAPAAIADCADYAPK